MQHWEPLGRIITSQAQLPTVLQLPDCWRIYYSKRDSEKRSRPHFIDVKKGDPKTILAQGEVAIELGPIGSFDHYGVMPSCAIMIDGTIYLYYVGWSIRKDVPYHNMVGLATSRDGYAYEKHGPVVATSIDNPYFTGTATVVKDLNCYRMYHMSCTEWRSGEPPEPRYHLKQSTSRDGVRWKHHSVAVDYKSDTEAGISSATLHGTDLIHMWYSYRQIDGYRDNPRDAYRIGCATSQYGNIWTRCDQVVDIPRSDWDSVMQCYPEVVSYDNKLWMFYNGNGFGQTGIGVTSLNLLR